MDSFIGLNYAIVVTNALSVLTTYYISFTGKYNIYEFLNYINHTLSQVTNYTDNNEKKKTLNKLINELNINEFSKYDMDEKADFSINIASPRVDPNANNFNYLIKEEPKSYHISKDDKLTDRSLNNISKL